MSEPDLYQEHVANLFSGEESEPVEEQSTPETPEPESAEPETPATDGGSVNWEVVARGRLREIDSLRETHRETRERMAELERNFKALHARVNPNEEIPPELLEADPALKYITGKLKAIEGQLQGSQRSLQEGADFQRDTHATVRYAQESRQAFVQHTPDWDQAYQFLREHFAQQSGRATAPDKNEWLNVQEHIAVKAWRENGEDPALKIYEMAVANGWRPGQVVAAAAGTAPAPQSTNGNGRIRRVRDAVAAPSPASIGTRDLGTDVLSREQFYDLYPQQERIRIFNSDRGEDIFESLMKTGRVTRSMLPR